MSDIIPDVLVYRTGYKTETNPGTLKEYIYDCKGMGSVADLYKNTAILTAFYTSMQDAGDEIDAAVRVHHLAPTPGNLGLIKLRMEDGVRILDSYADQVETIANDPANRDNREEAFVNIQLSFLTPYKLDASPKGIPDKPVLVGKHVTLGEVLIEVTNHGDTPPSQTTFFLLELPPVTDPVTPDPEVTIDNGIAHVKFYAAGEMFTQTVIGRGKNTTFTGLKFAGKYKGFAVSQNGKKQVSEISLGVDVQS